MILSSLSVDSTLSLCQVCLWVALYVSLSIGSTLSLSQSVCEYHCMSVCLWVALFLCLSLSVGITVCQSLSLTLQ